MVRDADLAMERAYLTKTGRLPRPFDAYPRAYLQALLLYGDEAQAELRAIVQESDDNDLDFVFQGRAPKRRPSGPPKRLPAPSSYDKPILTGDPIADAWERAIARGEIPDLDMKHA